MYDSKVVRFPDSSLQKLASLADEATDQLDQWCLHMVQEGIPPLHLVGILQYNMQIIMSSIGDEE